MLKLIAATARASPICSSLAIWRRWLVGVCFLRLSRRCWHHSSHAFRKSGVSRTVGMSTRSVPPGRRCVGSSGLISVSFSADSPAAQPTAASGATGVTSSGVTSSGVTSLCVKFARGGPHVFANGWPPLFDTLPCQICYGCTLIVFDRPHVFDRGNGTIGGHSGDVFGHTGDDFHDARASVTPFNRDIPAFL